MRIKVLSSILLLSRHYLFFFFTFFCYLGSISCGLIAHESMGVRSPSPMSVSIPCSMSALRRKVRERMMLMMMMMITSPSSSAPVRARRIVKLPLVSAWFSCRTVGASPNCGVDGAEVRAWGTVPGEFLKPSNGWRDEEGRGRGRWRERGVVLHLDAWR